MGRIIVRRKRRRDGADDESIPFAKKEVKTNVTKQPKKQISKPAAKKKK